MHILLFLCILVVGFRAIIWPYLPVGTKSLLIGVHQFAWHPITVWMAWRWLYRKRPSWRECVCIVIHDWGYWGCANMDGVEGEKHPYFGARIAFFLFGAEYEQLCLWHSRYLAKSCGREPSKLCWADKASMIFDPQTFYLDRARLTGELSEYRHNAARRGFIPLSASDIAWHDKLVAHLIALAQEQKKKHMEAA